MTAPQTLPSRTLDALRRFALWSCEVFLWIVGFPRRTMEATYRLAHTQEAQNPCLILLLWRDGGSSRGRASKSVANMNTLSPTLRQGCRPGDLLPGRDVLATACVTHEGIVGYAPDADSHHIQSSALRALTDLFPACHPSWWEGRPPPLKEAWEKGSARVIASPTPPQMRLVRAQGGAA